MSVVSRSLDRLEDSLENAASTPAKRLLLGLGGFVVLVGGAAIETLGGPLSLPLAVSADIIGLTGIATAVNPASLFQAHTEESGQQG